MIDPEHFFHTGVVVPDLAQAMQDVAGLLGIRWTPVQVFSLDIRMGSSVRPLRSAFAYSVSGPPYLELVEAIPDTPWAAGDGAALHHLGYWADDLPGEVARLERAGAVLEACDTGPERDMNVFAFVRWSNLRVELISSSRRNALLEMIATPPPD
jgi:hypothetical protein